MNTSNRLTLTAVAVATILIAGCGESDLEDQHLAELDAAREALQDQSQTGTGNPGAGTVDPATGAANPATGTADLAAGAVNLDGYSLVFAEEFVGSEIDASRWNTSLPWGPDFVINDEQQYYVDIQSDPDFGYDPFMLDSQFLTINAIPTPDGYEDRASDQSWLSGVLTSHQKFSFTHGYVEARIDVPEGQGLWPAFWMLPVENEGRKPQLFIMEHNGAQPETVFVNYNFENDQGQLATFGQRSYTAEGFDDGFHTVSLEWSPEHLKYYVDGVLLRTIPAGDLPEQDMYLILNLAVGGSFVGATDSSTPAEPGYRIDYIRVYQKP